MKDSQLLSWGRYPAYAQTSHNAFWRSDLSSLLQHSKSTLAFGNGRSYGDSCLAASLQVIQMRNLDRFISVDWDNGLIQAEAGVTLQDILQLAIPKGWFLPVTPGTQYVTLGGAIANDVHGKNHHVRGTFGCHVRCFNLVRSDRPEMICSREENAELFAATIGGLGLTGIISWVQLQLMPIQSSEMDTISIRFDSLNDFFSLSQTLDKQYEYTVAWVDCLAKKSNLGRGLFIAGNHAKSGPLKICKRKKITVPFALPFSVMNKFTLKIFNQLYYHYQKKEPQQKSLSYETFFYPLDRILKWNLLYGRKGFQQYQCVIPEICAQDVMREILKVISDKGCGSFLAVLKQCGAHSSPGLLSFPLPGVSLALDFPQNNQLVGLFALLDKLVCEAKGRLYPAKDAHMSAKDFKIFYPNWTYIEALRDPVLSSRFWQRVANNTEE